MIDEISTKLQLPFGKSRLIFQLYPKDFFPKLFTVGIEKQPVSLNLAPNLEIDPT